MYGVRNLDMSIRFSLRSWPSEGFPRPEMSSTNNSLMPDSRFVNEYKLNIRTVKPLLEDALLLNSQILERASIQGFQNFM